MQNTQNMGLRYFMGSDARMNRDEFDRFMQSFAGYTNNSFRNYLWNSADTQKDGRVSVDEMKEFLSKLIGNDLEMINHDHDEHDEGYTSKNTISTREMNLLMNKLLSQELLTSEYAQNSEVTPYYPPMNYTHQNYPENSRYYNNKPNMNRRKQIEAQRNNLHVNIFMVSNMNEYSNVNKNSNWRNSYDWQNNYENNYF